MSQSLMRFFVWVPFYWDMFHVSQTFCFSFGLVREPLVFPRSVCSEFPHWPKSKWPIRLGPMVDFGHFDFGHFDFGQFDFGQFD